MVNRAYVEQALRDQGLVEASTWQKVVTRRCRRVEEVEQFASEHFGENVGITLNRPGGDVSPYEHKRMTAACMVERRRIVLDIDAIDGHPEAPRRVALKLLQRLMAEGFPMPVQVDSGRGWHLIYRVRLAVDRDTNQMVGNFYEAVKRLVDGEPVSFDTSVKDLPRLLRLPGTVNPKNGRTTSAIMPAVWQNVPRKLIERIAAQAKPKPVNRPHFAKGIAPITGRGNFASLDVVSWFHSHGLYREHLADNMHWVRCPWEHEHTAPASRGGTIIYEADGGWPGFFCNHAHCQGRDIRDVIVLLGGADAFCSTHWAPDHPRDEKSLTDALSGVGGD